MKISENALLTILPTNQGILWDTATDEYSIFTRKECAIWKQLSAQTDLNIEAYLTQFPEHTRYVQALIKRKLLVDQDTFVIADKPACILSPATSIQALIRLEVVQMRSTIATWQKQQRGLLSLLKYITSIQAKPQPYSFSTLKYCCEKAITNQPIKAQCLYLCMSLYWLLKRRGFSCNLVLWAAIPIPLLLIAGFKIKMEVYCGGMPD